MTEFEKLVLRSLAQLIRQTRRTLDFDGEQSDLLIDLDNATAHDPFGIRKAAKEYGEKYKQYEGEEEESGGFKILLIGLSIPIGFVGFMMLVSWLFRSC